MTVEPRTSACVPPVWRCMLALLGVKLLLRIRGLAAAERVLRRRAERPVPMSGCGDPQLRAIAWSIAVAAALYPGRAMCLEQSLTLFYFLRRSGVSARLCIGVQSYPFGAHAWVEHDGEPVNEFPEYLRRFSTLPELSS